MLQQETPSATLPYSSQIIQQITRKLTKDKQLYAHKFMTDEQYSYDNETNTRGSFG